MGRRGRDLCAADETAGVALIAAAAGGPGSNTIVVPDATRAAADALGRWGFAPTAAGARMRLGPPVAWGPRCSSASSTCSGANAAKTPIPAPALVRSASIDRVWGLIVVGFLVVAVLGFVAGRVVEARRRRRGEGAKRARWRAEAVAQYVETQSRSTTLEERITAERVADALADVAARTAATTRPRERDDLEIARLASDRRPERRRPPPAPHLPSCDGNHPPAPPRRLASAQVRPRPAFRLQASHRNLEKWPMLMLTDNLEWWTRRFRSAPDRRRAARPAPPRTADDAGRHDPAVPRTGRFDRPPPRTAPPALTAPALPDRGSKTV